MKTPKLFIPKKGLVIRHPYTMTQIPDDGRVVDYDGEHSKFWRRRVKDGSATIEEPKTAKKTK